MSNLPKRKNSFFTCLDIPPEKCLKVATKTLEDLSDEIQLKIFSHLHIKDLISCSQVSKRTRRISRDESLWEKVNLCGKIIPANFLKFILENGSKYINLAFSEIRGGLILFENGESMSSGKYKVKYLNLANCAANYGVIEELIASCQSLEKLSLKNMGAMGSNKITMRRYVIPKTLNNLNPQKLKTLDLSSLNGIDHQCIQHILKSETLTEISFRDIKKLGYFKEWIEYVVNNLPINLEKISLGGLESLENEHVIKLVKKHKNLKQLELHGSPVENEALESIIEHAHNLEKLDVSFTRIGLFDYTKFLAVNSMPNLKVRMMTIVDFSDIL